MPRPSSRSPIRRARRRRSCKGRAAPGARGQPSATGVSGGGAGQPQFPPDIVRVLDAAQQQAMKAGDQFVTTERLLQALAKEGGVAKTVLAASGVTPDKLDAAVNELRKAKQDNATVAVIKHQGA